jgi:hypothetical protein
VYLISTGFGSGTKDTEMNKITLNKILFLMGLIFWRREERDNK